MTLVLHHTLTCVYIIGYDLIYILMLLLMVFVVSESVFVNVDPSTGEPQLYIVPNLVAFWQFASIHNDKDPNTPRLGRLQDVRQFVKILEYTIMKPVKHKEFMVS